MMEVYGICEMESDELFLNLRENHAIEFADRAM